MTEQLNRQTLEVQQGVAPNVELLKHVTSQEAVSQRHQWLQERLTDSHSGSLVRVARLMEQASNQSEIGMEAFNDGDWQKQEQQQKTSNDLKETAHRTYGRSAVIEYRKTRDALLTIEADHTLSFWGQEARRLFSEVLATTPIIEDGIDREYDIPPAGQSGASREDYALYLKKKEFTPKEQLDRATDKQAVVVTIEPSEESPFVIPVANVVSAGAFESWTGRFSGGGKKFTDAKGNSVEASSLDVIIDYAERDTPLPPLEKAVAYVQPDGVVLFEADVSNHRMAAAIARGQETVSVAGPIKIYQLERNIVASEPAK